MSRELTSISLLGSLPFSHAGGVQIDMVAKLPNLCYISVNAFRAKGKVKPFKLLLSEGSFSPELDRLGEAWEIADDVLAGLKRFVCHLYGGKTETSVNEVRVLLMRKKARTESGELNGRCNIDLFGSVATLSICTPPACEKGNLPSKDMEVSTRDIPSCTRSL